MLLNNSAAAVCIGQDQDIIKSYNVTFIKTYHVNRFISAVARNFYRSSVPGHGISRDYRFARKTTIGWMIKSILDALRTGCCYRASYCQMGNEICTIHDNAIHPFTLNALLHQAMQKGIHIAIIECSYTAIVKELLRHIWFDSIIYTDLYTYFQNDKADYHYLEIRSALIDHLKGVKSPIIVNVDDYYADKLKRDSLIGYGICRPCYVNAIDIELTPKGSRFSVVTPLGECEMTLNVTGIHNVYNALAVVAWGLNKGIELPRIQQGLMDFENPAAVGDASKSNKTVRIYVHEMAEMSELEEIYQKINNESGSKLTTLLSIRTQLNEMSYRENGHLICTYSELSIIVTNNSSKIQ